MNKTEIKTQLEEILSQDNIQSHLNKGKELSQAFWNIVNEELANIENEDLVEDENSTAEIEEGESVDDGNSTDEIDNEIKKLIESFKSRKTSFEKSVAQEEQKNLEIKKGIIARLRNLIQHEENIGVLFSEIKEIQENWKEIGNIPRKLAQEINHEYHNLTEQFYYNINIYKELKENDLKKNYSLKNQIVHKMKELLAEERITTVQNQLRMFQNDWAEIGPTYQEHWDKLKSDYYDTQNLIYEKIRSFYEQRKVEQEKNLALKKEYLQQAKARLADERTNNKTYDQVSKDLIDLQNKWKATGYATSKESKELWKEFRTLCNAFFDEKSAFFKEQNDGYKVNEKRKNQLINKATELLNASDFKEATLKIINLQKDWKKIGHAGRHAEQKLWKKFRTTCDDFFTKKDEHFKQKEQQLKINLELKEKLIEEVNSFQSKKEQKETVEELKVFTRKFAEIGHVPSPNKDKVNNAFKAAIDKHYEALDMTDLEKEKLFFEVKIDQILSSSNPGRMIRDEKDKIRKKITFLSAEINQYENNLGFFKNSKGAAALLGGVNSKIDNAKDQIDRLKSQLRLLPKEDSI